MALLTKPNVFQTGTVVDAAAVNADFDTIFNDYNGNIQDVNIAATGITTYGKVSGSALTVLGNINSGAGIVPVANLPVGTTANKVVQLDANAKLPAVDGSQLTGLPNPTIDTLLPSQGGNSGKFLTTNGSASSWGTLVAYKTYTNIRQTACVIDGTNTTIAINNTGGPLVKVVSFTLLGTGALTISYTVFATGNSGGTAVTNIYRNGSAIGTQRSTSNASNVTYTEKITGWSNGDTIDLYGYCGGSSGNASLISVYIYGTTAN